MNRRIQDEDQITAEQRARPIDLPNLPGRRVGRWVFATGTTALLAFLSLVIYVIAYLPGLGEGWTSEEFHAWIFKSALVGSCVLLALGGLALLLVTDFSEIPWQRWLAPSAVGVILTLLVVWARLQADELSARAHNDQLPSGSLQKLWDVVGLALLVATPLVAVAVFPRRYGRQSALILGSTLAAVGWVLLLVTRTP